MVFNLCQYALKISPYIHGASSHGFTDYPYNIYKFKNKKTEALIKASIVFLYSFIF